MTQNKSPRIAAEGLGKAKQLNRQPKSTGLQPLRHYTARAIQQLRTVGQQ